MEKKSYLSLILNLSVVAFVCALLVGLTGCSGGTAPGLSKAEVKRRHINAVHTNLHQIQEETDKLFLIDRPSRLTEMYTR